MSFTTPKMQQDEIRYPTREEEENEGTSPEKQGIITSDEASTTPFTDELAARDENTNISLDKPHIVTPTETATFFFEGKVYDDYSEMVKAKRERNKLMLESSGLLTTVAMIRAERVASLKPSRLASAKAATDIATHKELFSLCTSKINFNKIREWLNSNQADEKRFQEATHYRSPCGSGNITPLHRILMSSPPFDVVETFMVHSPGTAQIKDKHGRLPLHVACSYSASLEIVKILVQTYPDGVKSQTEKEGDLPLHLAYMFGATLEVLNFLIETYEEGTQTRNKKAKKPSDYFKPEKYAIKMDENGTVPPQFVGILSQPDKAACAHNQDISEESLITCHEAFLRGLKKENELCRECSDYKSLVVKRHSQSDMSGRYQCKEATKYSIEEINAAVPITQLSTRKRKVTQLLTITRSPPKRKLAKKSRSTMMEARSANNKTVTKMTSDTVTASVPLDKPAVTTTTNKAVTDGEAKGPVKTKMANNTTTKKLDGKAPMTCDPLASRSLDLSIAENIALRRRVQETESQYREILFQKEGEIARLSMLVMSTNCSPYSSHGIQVGSEESIACLWHQRHLEIMPHQNYNRLMEQELHRLKKIVEVKDEQISNTTRTANQCYNQLVWYASQQPGGSNPSQINSLGRLESLVASNIALRRQLQEMVTSQQEILARKNEEISRLTKLFEKKDKNINHLKMMEEQNFGATLLMHRNRFIEQEIMRLSRIVEAKDAEIAYGTRIAQHYYGQHLSYTATYR